MDLLIKNGIVYDPINKINGEKMDIFTSNGKIVSNAKDPKVIDADGKLVLPGGVEGHSHIAGGKVNAGRIMRPEDGRKGIEPKGKLTRACSGYSVPNVYATGYRYARMGYTFVMEAAMPPMAARHTHEELIEIPIVDKGAIPLLDNHWMTMECVKSGDMDKLTAYVAWILKATKGYGIKIVNPGGVEAWAWGKNVSGLHDRVPKFDVSPAEIVKALSIANERLNLPHSIHIHCNNIGHPGNSETTLETYGLLSGVENSDRQVMHATHTQFHSYGGSNWGDFCSKADEVAKYVNAHDNLTIDLGVVMFCDTTTMTGDGPHEFNLYKLTRRKWSNHDVELETGSGVVPFVYGAKIPPHAIMWAVGIELPLLIDDPWKMMITTDHPNGCPFTFYPQIFALLMSKKKREAMISEVHPVVNSNTILPSIDRELGWNDIAIMTRAAPARILGIDKHGKGHLGSGADADISIYDISPEEVDPSRDYAKIEDAFSYTAYTIKSGQIVAKDNEIVAVPSGKTFFVDPEIDKSLMDAMLPDLELKFKEYYSINLANYPVQDAYVPNPYKISTKGA